MIEIDGRTKVAGLIGDPVEHTKSPAIHNFLAEKLHDNIVYLPFHVKPEGLSDAVSGAFDLGVTGLNVTVPHKQNVMREAAELDTAALEIGAVNTLVRSERGYIGYNTDYIGFIRELQHYSVDVNGREAVVLGAGGAAKAVVYGLKKLGASRIYVMNRTKERAAAAFGNMENVSILSYMEAERLSGKKYVCIQCTSVGLQTGDDSCVVSDDAFFDMVDTGIDIIYKQGGTGFMKRVAAHGGRSYDGLRMLMYQAVSAYELFTDRKIPPELTEELYEKLDS